MSRAEEAEPQMTATSETPASAFPPGEYTTRDDRKAKAFAILDGYLFGAIEDGNGGWSSHIWMLDGRDDAQFESGRDLLPPRPPTRKVRVRVAVTNMGRRLAAYALTEEEAHHDIPAMWLGDMSDGQPVEVEIEIIDRRAGIAKPPPPAPPAAARETDGQLLTRLGMDGLAWTDEMIARGLVKPEDRDVALGWLCNAIKAGYDRGRTLGQREGREGPPPTTDKPPQPAQPAWLAEREKKDA